MKYMLLIYGNEQAWDEAGREACYAESAQLAQDLSVSGHFVAASPLHSVSTAKSVRMRGGKQLVTDGPFAETYEQLGGYFIVEASDIDEAVEIAARIPGGRIGSVEVRPILEIAGLPDAAPAARQLARV